MPSHRTSPRVPPDLALLYAFVNSLDLRRFVEAGVPHTTSDRLGSLAGLEAWMRDHQLLSRDARLDRNDHRRAVELRDAIRELLQLAPDRRGAERARLSGAAARFPLIVQLSEAGEIRLEPMPGRPIDGLGAILAALCHAAETGRLDRLKMCASDECHWVFYDRSKPGSRRWCSSALCGNRAKTRAYRSRHGRRPAPEAA
jgi:predicted RNA-binding Zn ribbon-like protein